MTDYALLVLASANRVYADAAVALTMAELRVFDERALGARIHEVAEVYLAGVRYVTFTAEELGESEIALLSNLSSLHALYAREGELLRPVPIRRLDRFDSDLLTIQKYRGKTNEQFTKLLLNVTVLASDRGTELASRRMRVLDPMCGRGTTLNQALMYGWDASGVDIDGADIDAYATFLSTWLKHKRLKHQFAQGPIRRNKVTLGRQVQASIGATKEEFRAGTVTQVRAVHADTRSAAQFFPAGSFDVLVTDLPYGVAHGSRAGADRLSRGPQQLLAEALPGWASLIRPGGALGISWNTLVGPRPQIAQMLSGAGLEVLADHGYADFAHRVDQAIVRDLIVARRPALARS